MTDLTKFKRTEQALVERNKTVELLRTVAAAANEAESADQAIQTCIDAVCAYIGWPVGHAFVMADDGSGELVSAGLWHLDDADRFEIFRTVSSGIRFTDGVGLPGRVLASGEPQWIYDVSRDSNFPRAGLAKNLGVKTGFAFPVMVGRSTAAVLEFFTASVIEPDAELLETMRQIGTQLGRVIERERAEEAMRESERKAAEAQDLLMDAIESSPDGIAIYDSDDRLVVFNDKYRTGVLKGIADVIEVGVTYEELLRAAVDRGLTKVRDGDVAQYIETRLAHHRRGEGSMEIELPNDRWMLARERRMRSGGIVGTRADITEVKRAEKALRESEERFRAVVDNSPVALLLKDSEGRFVMMNRRFQEWFGFGDDAIGKTTQDLYPKEFAEVLLAQDDEVLATGKPLEQEYEATFVDGTKHKVVLTKFPVIGSYGDTIGVGSVGIDVTQQRRTEEQLNQAQKMEAVGQLTGGVAHDFNNLLAIIRGNLELVEDTAGVDADTIRNVAHAMRATDRAADLTQRLLAFSRRQTLQPKVVDLNDLVGTMGELLRRTLGETIEVRTIAAGALWLCEVDPAQMENALLNLAINARDAMANGGKLTIETSNVRLDDDYAAAQAEVVPGQYVQLAVSDTGVGMLPDVADRAFEPFFTTKDVGKGSGLGLSMIYGFVKQSGGYVRIYSEEGKGTTVKIYLPRCRKDGSEAETEDQKQDSPMGRGETVLVVEDDPDVRTLAVILLQNLGYRTVDARTGQDALALFDDLPQIDLMLTDVVLPGGMNGRELSEIVRDRYPGLPVVFMSGYTQDAVIHHGRLDDGIELLQKPFRKHELAAKVQNALKR